MAETGKCVVGHTTQKLTLLMIVGKFSLLPNLGNTAQISGLRINSNKSGIVPTDAFFPV